MFWSITPAIAFLIVIFFAIGLNLGNFPQGGNGFVIVPESLFADFSIFIAAVMMIIVPIGVAATLANIKLAKNWDVRSWHSMFSREVWVTIQVFTGFITCLFLIIIQVFKS